MSAGARASDIRGADAAHDLRPAVFLDRDGTLTDEGEWVTTSADLALLPSAAPAIALLNRAGYLVVLTTNQSAIARGLLTEHELEAIHRELQREIAQAGARLDGVYYCPHHPSAGAAPYRRECDCRKPKPGLLARAAAELRIDLGRSFVVGDAERDLAAGAALGVRGILVATGKGAEERERLRREGREPERCAPDVLAAARWIVDQGR